MAGFEGCFVSDSGTKRIIKKKSNSPIIVARVTTEARL